MPARMLLSAVLLACATPSYACDNYPDLPTLPGETEEANKARNDKLHESLSIIRKHELQTTAFKEANRVYLARVLRREILDRNAGLYSIQTAPVHGIKGKAPMPAQTLSDVGRNSCERWGGGEATAASAGDWVIIFEGVAKSARNPLGIYSIYARDALLWDLVEQIEEFSLARGGQRP